MIIIRRTQMAAIMTYKVANVCVVGTWSAVAVVGGNGGRVVGRVVIPVRST